VRFDSAWSARTSSVFAASIGASEVDATAMDGTVVDAIDRGRDVELRFRADLHRAGTALGDVLVGAAVKAYRYDYDLYVNDLWTPYEIVTRDLEAHERGSFTDLAAYAEATHSLPWRGRLLAGLRLDHWSAASVTAGSPRVKAEFVPARSLRLVGYWGIYRQGVPYIWMASAPENADLASIVSRQFGGGFDVEPGR
jgi:TonB dependent receptor-like, beta-barrel